MTHLQRSEIKCAFTGLSVRQFDLRVDFVRLQLPDHAFWATHANLRLRNRFGTDLELRWHVLKDDGRMHSHFGGLLVGCNEKPQASSHH